MAKKIILFLLMLTSLIAVSPAYAAMKYVVASGDNTTLGKSAYGTAGSNYVMSRPTIYDQHVSSFYVDNETSPRNFAEVGWFANTTQSSKKPRFLPLG